MLSHTTLLMQKLIKSSIFYIFFKKKSHQNVHDLLQKHYIERERERERKR